MAAIKARMAELQALHGRAALVSFAETRAAQDGVEVATAEVTRLFRAAEARLASFNGAAGGAPLSPADAKVRDAVRRTLAAELQGLSLQFRRQQKAYLEKLRAARGFGGGGGGGGGGGHAKPASTAGAFALLDGDGDDDGDGLAGGLGAAPAAFTQAQATRAGGLAALAAERDRDVAAVTASIAALAQIMKDLSALVIEQGTVLDRIDYNLEAAAVSVDAGVRQLVRAEKAQRAGRLVSCILLLAALVVFMLLVIVLRAVF
jgi:syntaxin 16